jgi:hypothetical protein
MPRFGRIVELFSGFGMRIEAILLVFHRILDFKTGWMSILALFFFVLLPLRTIHFTQTKKMNDFQMGG